MSARDIHWERKKGFLREIRENLNKWKDGLGDSILKNVNSPQIHL